MRSEETEVVTGEVIDMSGMSMDLEAVDGGGTCRSRGRGRFAATTAAGLALGALPVVVDMVRQAAGQ